MADGGHIGPAEHGVLLTEAKRDDAKRDDANPVHGPSQIQINRYSRNSWSAGESSKKTKNLMSSNPLSKHDKNDRRLSRWFVTNQKVEAWDEKALNTLHVCILVSLVVVYACHVIGSPFLQFVKDDSILVGHGKGVLHRRLILRDLCNALSLERVFTLKFEQHNVHFHALEVKVLANAVIRTIWHSL